MTTWVMLRAAGIGAYVMVFLSVAWGLIATTSLIGKRVSRASATTVHQFIATTGLVLLGVHLAGLLVDPFMPFGVRELAIPMASTYRPVAVTTGVVAMYTMVGVIVLSWMRKTIGTTWWRRSHLLAVPVFAMSLVHGLLAGTDSQRPAMWWLYLATGLVVVFLVLVRGLTFGFRPARAPRPEDAARPERAARPPSPRAGEPANA
jgi:methionine sulfoxide reductase heme-binding subunit